MLFLFKRNDSWVLPFNILLIIGLFFVCKTSDAPFSILQFLWLLFILLQSLLMNVFLERFALIKQKSHVPQLVSALLLIALTPHNQLSYSILCAFALQYISLFSLLSYNDKITQNYKHQSFLFNQGVVLGFSVLLYFPLMYGIVAFFFTFLTLFGFRVKEFLGFLVGVAFPFIYYYSYLYLFNTTYTFWNTPAVYFQYSASFWVFVVVLCIISLLGLYRVLTKLGVKNIKVRQAYKILWTYFGVILVGWLISFNSFSLLFLGSPFLVFCLSFIFLNPKSKWISSILFWGFLIAFTLRFLPWTIFTG